MTTIRDVAKRAGVAPMTVSRVINGSGYTSEATRRRVEAAIEELNYVPNSLARSLRSNQTHTLALVLSDVTNPFWTTVARGAEDAASQAGFNIILCNTDESEEKQAQYLAMLLQKQVDGFILVPAGSRIEPVAAIQARQVPLVVLDRCVPGAEVDVVRGASWQGAYDMVAYLLELGHRRIAMLSGPADLSVSQERVAGYRRALQKAGLTPAEELILYGPFTQVGGYQMMEQMLSNSEPPTAVFAGNNFIAIGAMHALREAGLHVPDDMSLVAFDDLPDGFLLEPFLTVVVQPAYELGQRAVEQLLHRIEGDHSTPIHEVILPTELIIRRSCRVLSPTP